MFWERVFDLLESFVNFSQLFYGTIAELVSDGGADRADSDLAENKALHLFRIESGSFDFENEVESANNLVFKVKLLMEGYGFSEVIDLIFFQRSESLKDLNFPIGYID